MGTSSLSPVVSSESIREAATLISKVVRETPLELSPRLSALAGCPVLLKREDLQPVRSYKLRGAYNLISSLSDAERAAGVVTASAGNHAQGVALSCREWGIQGRIYVPTTTPRQKRDRITSIGGANVELIMTGDTFDDAAEAAALDAKRSGATMVPPFDDPRVASGQGTVAMEAQRQAREQYGLDVGAFVAPVGGGGLIAGCGTWLAEQSPESRLVGVEPAGAASMAKAIENGGPVTLDSIDSFVDGAAVRRVGDLNYSVVNALRPQLLRVDEGALCTEMLNLYQIEGVIAEPAGALAASAVATGKVGTGESAAVRVSPGAAIVVVVSGGNNDVSRYNEVVERSLVHEGLKHYFLVTFAQEPGALRRFLDEVLGPDDDITLFEYVKRNNREQGPALVGLEIGRKEDLPGLLSRMEKVNMDIERIDPQDPMYRFLT